jgi:hypothetical protein
MKNPVKDKLRPFELFERFGAANFSRNCTSVIPAKAFSRPINEPVKAWGD